MIEKGKTAKVFISCDEKGKGISKILIKWRCRMPEGAKILGDALERSYGELEWRGIVPDRLMPWYFMIHDGGKTSGIGVKTGASALCCWQADQNGFYLTLDTRSGGKGVQLKGRTLAACEIVFYEGEEGDTPYQASCKFMKELCSKPLLPKMTVYGFNDWYYAYGRNSAERILKDSEFCSDLAENTGNRPFSVIDGGWQYTGVTGGAPWSLSGRKFPDMKDLASKIKKAGCRPGIWYRPLLTSEDSPWVKISRATRFKGHPNPHEIVLDPTEPENLERIKDDVRLFRKWGYELIKHDFSSWDVFGRWGFQMIDGVTENGWSFNDNSKTNAEILKGIYKTIFDAADGAVIIGCNTVGHLITGYAHLQRIGDDTSGQEWARTRKMGVNTLAFRACQNRSFFALDADCVGITEDIPWRLNSQWLDLLSRSGSPLFVSAKREVIGKEQRKALKEAFSRASAQLPAGEPLDWMDTSCPARWNLDGETVEYNWSE
ncbi:MAG TPA: hypothetical protein DET40_22050 [Lentisphaeria bacterium]|nr:MAG: hypothetical protein A2X45_04140 [Lentisphaerae bacterium GWF2_50_93]HCE46237.1 hypothetical protein [Lentisphaeria bacterium]